MAKIQIDKDIPMPQARGPETIYPFAEMEIGDSFYVEGKKGATIHAAIQNYIRKGEKIDRDFNRKFACRSDAKGVRVWRTQ